MSNRELDRHATQSAEKFVIGHDRYAEKLLTYNFCNSASILTKTVAII